MTKKKYKPNQNSPWLYFALTYGWSWIFLLPPILGGLDTNQPLTAWLGILSGIGPALIALILLYTRSSYQYRHEYWRRLFSYRRINGHWWFVIFFTPLVLTLMSGGLDFLLGGSELRLESGLPGWTDPMAWLGFVIFILFFGPVPEEMGWRGYVLDSLQDRWSALFSSLILGSAWALWHLPLFFIKGTYQANLGVFTVDFWLFLLMMIPETVLMTWIYNNNKRSTLSAVFFHFAINLTGEVFNLSPTGVWFYFGFWVLAAGLVVCFTNPTTLRKV